MAYYRKRGSSWSATVDLKGCPSMTASFPTKREAVNWAVAEEAAIRAGRRGIYPNKTLTQALERYEADVSSKKRGGPAEVKRLNALKKDFPDLAAKTLYKITAAELVEWRDARLAKVKSGSVLRDISLLRNVWITAAREWGWCGEPTPWRQIKLPADSPAREAMWRWQQVRRLLRRLGYKTGRAPTTPKEEVGHMFLLALHTAMRLGEIHSLKKGDIDMTTRVVRLGEHKTMEKVGTRRVPVPRRAAKVLKVLVGNAGKDGRLFKLSKASVDTLFRKYRDQCLIKGVTFHDARAAALTWLSRRVDIQVLTRISGHVDASLILNRYYRERADQIAARI